MLNCKPGYRETRPENSGLDGTTTGNHIGIAMAEPGLWMNYYLPGHIGNSDGYPVYGGVLRSATRSRLFSGPSPIRSRIEKDLWA